MRTNQIPEFYTSGLLKHLQWLRQLSGPVKRIVTYGCISSEPFVLLWMFEASEVKVVEKDGSSLNVQMGPIEERELLSKKWPEIYKPNSVEFITADMSMTIPKLLSDYFDLAFCENTLYNMESDSEALQGAVSQMVRVVRPGGWIIAVESKFGATHTFIGELPVATSPPKDISYLFDSMGLVRVTLNAAPQWAYCFIKPAA